MIKKIISMSGANGPEAASGTDLWEPVHPHLFRPNELAGVLSQNDSFGKITRQALDECVDWLINRDAKKDLMGRCYIYPVKTLLDCITALLKLPEISVQDKICVSCRIRGAKSTIRDLIRSKHGAESNLGTADQEWDLLFRWLVFKDGDVQSDRHASSEGISQPDTALALINMYKPALDGVIGGNKPCRVTMLARIGWIGHVLQGEALGEAESIYTAQKARKFGANSTRVVVALLVLSAKFCRPVIHHQILTIQPMSPSRRAVIGMRQFLASSTRTVAGVASWVVGKGLDFGTSVGCEAVVQGGELFAQCVKYAQIFLDSEESGNKAEQDQGTTNNNSATKDGSPSTQTGNNGGSGSGDGHYGSDGGASGIEGSNKPE